MASSVLRAGETENPVLQLMREAVIPASGIVFEASAEVPADEAAWQEVEQAATLLFASAQKMAAVPPGLVPVPWQEDAVAFIQASDAARRAVMNRDIEALEAANDTLFQSCESCHLTYLPSGASALPANP
jgi:hypothetical protein